jgi:class 3 adenylate cyclase/tetratricopeptide (TPR) repeat protein
MARTGQFGDHRRIDLACAACATPHPPDARFCGHCGTRLSVVCPGCGAVLPSALTFCMSCGTRVATHTGAADSAPAPPTRLPVPERDERKVVTVLFADLVGFTERAEQLDPEDVRATLTAYWSTVRRVLERYGGTVEKFIGDAVMACFGAPTTHEDDPTRAVLAAFAVQEALVEASAQRPDVPLRVRIGVNTGEAVVSLGGGDGAGMVSGDVVNVAARLQAAAPPGGILVGEITHRATRQLVDYREQPPMQVRGKTTLVTTWLAERLLHRVGFNDNDAGPGLVGREPELGLLTSTFHRAVREGTPQLVTLVGDPGIGKSRLVRELSQYTDALPDLLVWRRGRCLPYGEGVTFAALGEIVKAQTGILETDSADVKARRLADGVDAIVDEAESAFVAQRLAPLVGLEAPAGITPAESFAAWRRFVSALTHSGPAVVVFEDLHWADDGLLDFVDELVVEGEGPLLIVCTTRPELLERRPAWSGGLRNAVTISLSPLTDTETAQLFGDLLGQAVFPADVQQRLLSLAGGNPLYAEEYVGMLVDQGALHRDSGAWALDAASNLPLPDSVQGIISSRLDALTLAEKLVLQDASVLGQVFWVGVLAAISGHPRDHVEAQLRQLEERELVRASRSTSVAGEPEWSFRHVLVRDVAYAQMPRRLRADRHQRAAEWIESLTQGRDDDRAEMLAHHWLAALDLAAALGGDAAATLRDPARVALHRAAERAFRLHALAPAYQYASRTLELWPDELDPVRRWLTVLLREEARFLAHEDEFYRGDGPERLREASRALLRLDATAEAARVETLLGQVEWYRAERTAAFHHLQAAVDLLAPEPPSEQKASAYAELARLQMLSHQHEKAVAYGRLALQMAQDLDLLETAANVLVTIGTARYLAGDPGGIADQEEAVELSRAHGLRALHRAANNLAATLQEEGELRRSYALIEESERVGRGVGLSLTTKFSEADLAIRLFWEGDWVTSMEVADSFFGKLSEDTPHPWEIHLRSLRSLIRVLSGQPPVDDSVRTLELARRGRYPQLLRPALAYCAATALSTGDNETGLALLDELLDDWEADPASASREWLHPLIEGVGDVMESLTHKTLWVRAALAFGYAALAMHEGAHDEAARGYLDAVAIYEQIGDVTEAMHCRMFAGRSLFDGGRPAEALPLLEESCEFLRRNRAVVLLAICEWVRDQARDAVAADTPSAPTTSLDDARHA